MTSTGVHEACEATTCSTPVASFIMKWLKPVSNPHREGLIHVEYGERQVGKCSFHLSGSANPETAYGLVDGERYRGRERFGRARESYPDMLRPSYAPRLLSMPIAALPATPECDNITEFC